MSNPQPSIILLVAVCVIATTSFAEEAPTPLSPQFQRENLELKQRQSQASQGLKLDAGERLDLYDLEMRQRREQQQLQERQRQQLEVQDRRDTAGDAGRLNQQHILQRERDQQMQSFRRELDQWRAKRQNPGRSQ